MTSSTDHSNEYNDDSFWAKILSLVGNAAYQLLLQAIALYHCAQDSETPLWAKTSIYGALGYLISPLDIIPDFTPVVGLNDDWGVIVLAITAIGVNLKQKHYDEAQRYLDMLLQRNNKKN